jgi:hypothetical protein
MAEFALGTDGALCSPGAMSSESLIAPSRHWRASVRVSWGWSLKLEEQGADCGKIIRVASLFCGVGTFPQISPSLRCLPSALVFLEGEDKWCSPETAVLMEPKEGA